MSRPLESEQRSDARERAGCSAIRMWYFLRISNAGDRIGPNLVSHITGRPTVHSAEASKSRLFTIGSIADGVDANGIVWGAGLMDPGPQRIQAVQSNIFALRGKLSHGELRKAGLGVSDVPLGDPGILARALLKERSKKKYRLGVIAHYVDQIHPWVNAVASEEGVLLIDIRKDPESVLREIDACENIVSSSLHGLIFSEALDIPNLWVGLSERVIRTGFKFRDWFSTTGKPQEEPFVPKEADSAKEVIHRATLHDCQIDTSELTAAFPFSRLEELSDRVDGTFVSLANARRKPLPIFVISYNRAKFLERCLLSYKRMNRDIDIIVHDNGSDDEKVLKVLSKIVESGGTVYRRSKISGPDDLNQINETITDYFSRWSEPSRYVVTDCDIDLTIADPSSLDVYDELLDRYTSAQCVGPMLRIRDIPRTYPLFRRAISRHIEQFWSRHPDWSELDSGPVATLEALIDTTFALHRAGEPFHRLKSGRRVYYPYEAKHLDWYLNRRQYLRSLYFSTSSSDISHWNNSVAEELDKDVHPNLGTIIYVDRGNDGRLVEKTLDLDGKNSLWRRARAGLVGARR